MAEKLVSQMVQEIIERCDRDGLHVQETLVIFLLKAVVLERSSEFNLNEELSGTAVEKLVQLCVSRVKDQNSATMTTIKMQVAYGSAYLAETEAEATEKERKSKQIFSLLKEILEAKMRTSEALYRKIITFMLVTSELGLPTDIDVVREAAAALESVFPQSDLPTFVEMTNKEKEQQLTELTNIVVGIRLFNKDIGQGGAGIEDTSKLATSMSEQVCTRLEALLKIVEQQVEDYVSVISSVHRNEMQINAPIQKLQDELNNRRQFLSYLMSLNQEATTIRSQLLEVKDQYSQRLAELKSIVKSRSAVPTDQVFPRFIAIAGLWAQVKQEFDKMKIRNGVLDALLKVESTFKPSLISDDVRVARVHAETRIESQTPEVTPRAIESAPLVDVILPQSNHPKFRDIPLDFKGYCPWTLIHRGGLALPGDRMFGIAVYKDMHFVFTSSKAITDFQRDPEKYFQGVIEMAKKAPELIHLLDLHKHIPDMSIVSQYGRGRQGVHPLLASRITTSDASTETPVHFVESHIEKDYTWNEWELRRRAIKLTNLRSKATHSTQTGKSHFRRENTTQHYEQKEKNQQTTVDSSTNVPVQARYVTGIKGGPETKMQIVRLTLDLTE